MWQFEGISFLIGIIFGLVIGYFIWVKLNENERRYY